MSIAMSKQEGLRAQAAMITNYANVMASKGLKERAKWAHIEAAKVLEQLDTYSFAPHQIPAMLELVA